MPPTPDRRPDTTRSRRRFALARADAWGHRWGALSWALAAGAFLLYFGVAYRAQILSFKGGAAAFSLAATPVAEAMRPLSGPAERLDTYAGYVTYHNTSILALLLSLWAVIQGARAIRGWEERGGIEIWLATGRARWTLIRDQSLGFAGPLALVTLGLGLGLGGGTAVAGAADWGGAFVVAGETALVVAAFFALGLLLSQLTTTARAGAGLATVAMVGVYLLGNMAADLGWFGWIRFLSPFFYFQQSRVLIPGHTADLLATLILLLATLVTIALAAAAFANRDLGAALWRRPAWLSAVSGRRVRPVGTTAFWLRDAWLSDLRAQRLTIAIWAVAGAGFMALMVVVAKQVTGVWESSDLIRQLLGRLPGQTFLDQYMSYVGILAAIAPAAYAVTEASRWLSDLGEGRATILLSVSGSRSRLVFEWAASALAGIAIVSFAVLAGSFLGAAAAGIGLRPEGILRTAAVATLLGAGIGGVALTVVVVFRSGFAVGALGAWLGIGFFVSVLGPMFRWPEWVIRLSPFDAFGTPYINLPRTGGLALLGAFAVIGTATAALVGQRRASLV